MKKWNFSSPIATVVLDQNLDHNSIISWQNFEQQGPLFTPYQDGDNRVFPVQNRPKFEKFLFWNFFISKSTEHRRQAFKQAPKVAERLSINQSVTIGAAWPKNCAI